VVSEHTNKSNIKRWGRWGRHWRMLSYSSQISHRHLHSADVNIWERARRELCVTL